MSIFSAATPLELTIYRHIRVIHAVKICLALVVAHLINAFHPVPHIAWTSVTIVIIMLTLPQVGGTLEKSIQRASGTILGACYAIAILTLTSQPWLIALLAMAGIAAAAFWATGRMSYTYMVAGFTLMIVLDGGGQSREEAFWRTGTILLGCIIALLVSLLVLPLRARNEWRWQLAKSLSHMNDIWQTHLPNPADEESRIEQEFKQVEQAIMRQKSLQKSVMLECKTLRKQPKVLEQLIAAQNRCLLVLEQLVQTRWETQCSAQAIQQLLQQGAIDCEFGQDLQALASFCSGESETMPPSRQEAIQAYRQAVQSSLNEQQAFHLNANGYAWLVYQAGQHIEAINQLIRQIHEASTPSAS